MYSVQLDADIIHRLGGGVLWYLLIFGSQVLKQIHEP